MFLLSTFLIFQGSYFFVRGIRGSANFLIPSFIMF